MSESALNFLIIDFLQNSYQTEKLFFPRPGPGALLAIWSHLEFVVQKQSYWTVLLELGLALDHFIWHLSGWLQCCPVECRDQFSVQHVWCHSHCDPSWNSYVRNREITLEAYLRNCIHNWGISYRRIFNEIWIISVKTCLVSGKFNFQHYSGRLYVIFSPLFQTN